MVPVGRPRAGLSDLDPLHYLSGLQHPLTLRT